MTVTINDPTDNTDVTANPASLTFSTSNWDPCAQTSRFRRPRTATAGHGHGDAHRGRRGLRSFAASSVAVTVTDNDTPGVTVTPMSLTVGEGGTGTYTVVLNTLPTGDVTVGIVSNNTDVTVSLVQH